MRETRRGKRAPEPWNSICEFITHDIEEAIYLSDRIWLLSRRPSRIIEELRIDFVRPRHQVTTRGEARFMELRNKIYRRIGHEGAAWSVHGG
jgi:NitT/TauT family transport system ATP-binding protein